MLASLRYWWPGESVPQLIGRPRERWYTTDYPDRLDANELRREWLAERVNPARVEAIEVLHQSRGETLRERIEVVAYPDRVYGWRVWIVCPGCGSRRVHLYNRRAGIRCRACAGISYRPGGSARRRARG